MVGVDDSILQESSQPRLVEWLTWSDDRLRLILRYYNKDEAAFQSLIYRTQNRHRKQKPLHSYRSFDRSARTREFQVSRFRACTVCIHKRTSLYRRKLQDSHFSVVFKRTIHVGVASAGGWGQRRPLCLRLK